MGESIEAPIRALISDGYDAVQLGLMEFVKPARINKPVTGHLKKSGAGGVRFMRELRLTPTDDDLKTGDKVVLTNRSVLMFFFSDRPQLDANDIVIPSMIDPGMAPLFVIAAGLVAELGGTLSHGAIIAREYGLPAVVNVPGATAWIREGDSLVVDATRGNVVVQRETDVTS